MNKIENNVNQVSTLTQIVLLVSLGTFVISLMLPFNQGYIILLTTPLIALGFYMLYKSPKLKITLFEWDGDIFFYRIPDEHRIGFSAKYLDPIEININDILYLEIQMVGNSKYGGSLTVKCYSKESGVISLMFNSRYAEKVYDILDRVLETHTSILLVKAEFYDASYVFRGLKDRIINEVPYDYDYGGWKRKQPFKMKIEPNDWGKLLMAPVAVFLKIAKVNGGVTKNEINSFVKQIRSAESFKSFILAEILQDVGEEIDRLLVDIVDEDLDAILMEAIKVLRFHVDEEEADHFKSGLLIIAEKLTALEKTSENNILDAKNTLKQLSVSLQ